MILLDPLARPVIAHRGASARAPENTMAAFRLAVQLGADALELDVRPSADGVPVVIHDATLERTTDATGPVTDHTVAELRGANAARHFRPRDGSSPGPEPIPTLEEVLVAFPSVPLLIEVKDPTAQDAVADLLLRIGAAERCLLAAERHAALAAFRRPPFLVGASRRDVARLYFGAAVGLPPRNVAYRALSVPVRFHGLPVPTAGFVTAARRLGCPVHVWTVDEPGLAHTLWQVGVAGIVTNAPEAILPPEGQSTRDPDAGARR